MFYTIYKITNILSGKYYIGKHQTDNLDDGYMGSGIKIKNAIRKHGVGNFVKEILFIFNNEDDMNKKEKELVVISEETYNLAIGGYGGQIVLKKDHPLYEATKEKLRMQRQSEEYKELKRQQAINQHIFKNIGMYNKNHSNKTKELMSNNHWSKQGLLPWNKGKSFKIKNKILCNYCNKTVSKGNFTRWHGERCKKNV